MMTLQGRRVLVAITGGIAAYKCVELVRRLKDRQAQVRVLMTESAQAFVGPLTFQAVSGEPVHTELLDPAAEQGMGHIELARWAEFMLVAPATANHMARLAQGFADDLLGAVWLAHAGQKIIAPAMNQQMWRAPAVQRNAAVLQGDEVLILGPASGAQACGDVGPGRMLEPADLLAQLEALCFRKDLHGLKVVVTAGPTRERLDPVRYISNFSSGKMGYAVAEAFAERGADVDLVSGPVQLSTPVGVRRIDVESAGEMHKEVMLLASFADVFVATAAVADFRVDAVAAQKIKKDASGLQLNLVPNTDILADVASLSEECRPFVVGFAAETQQVQHFGRDKLERKRLDMIACNDVSAPGLGFGSDRNALWLLWKDGSCQLAEASKKHLARQLVDHILEQRTRQGVHD